MKKAEEGRKAKLMAQKNVPAQSSSPPKQDVEVEVIEEKLGGEKKEEPQGSPSTNSKIDDAFEPSGNERGSFWSQCDHDSVKPSKINEKPPDSIAENQGVMCLLVVPTGLEPVSPA